MQPAPRRLIANDSNDPQTSCASRPWWLLSRLADLRDLVELRHRRIRIHRLAHQPAELREVGNHTKRSRQVVLRVSMLSRPMVDFDFRDTSTELACNRWKVPVHP